MKKNAVSNEHKNNTCSSHQTKKADDSHDQDMINRRMSHIKHKIIVLSGKGGVGKSTFAVNLAVALSKAGKKVGLLDIDIHGPSIPKLLNMETVRLIESDGIIIAPYFNNDIKVMSVGFLLRKVESAVILRGPIKTSLIRQFLRDVDWGVLDYLIIDSPPGTGDEPLSICQLIEKADGAIIVTTPQELSLNDVTKSIDFCNELDVSVLGVVENMSGFICPNCDNIINIFKKGGGEKMASEMNVPFLGSIPLEPNIVEACDLGNPYVSRHSEDKTAQAFNAVIKPIIELDIMEKKNQKEEIENMNDKKIRIAIPMAEGKLAQHFGHCEKFVLCDVDIEKKEIINNTLITPPPHEPGILPPWLAKQGVHKIITGGMGHRALSLFNEQRIEVLTGALSEEPNKIVKSYLDGNLITGINVCDHGENSCGQ
ncbi:iron-sulfur cluster carrier protein MrpORP [candidate division KSB1 bacterium]